MKFSWVLVFDLGISKGWHKILQNFQGWKLIFSGISKGKVTNLKIPEGGFQKSISTGPPVWSFSGIVQWIGEFHPKSQITILVTRQLKLFQKKFPNSGEGWGRVSHRCWEHGRNCNPPLTLRNLMRGLGGGLELIHGGSIGGLKCCQKHLWRSSFVSKNTGYKPASLQIY